MKYDLIFYLSKKTSYCEKALKKALSKIGGEANRITSATTPVTLGEEVTHSLKLCPLTVIIGGFNSDYDDNLATVLSRVFSTSKLTLSNMRKLSCDSGAQGYIVRDKSQILLALPDSPAAITQMCGDKLLSYIDEKLNKPSENTEETEKTDAAEETANTEETKGSKASAK